MEKTTNPIIKISFQSYILDAISSPGAWHPSMEANNAKTTSQGILAHDKATVKLTTSTSGVSLVRRHSPFFFWGGGGGGMIDLQNDPFQKILSWYYLKISSSLNGLFLMNQWYVFHHYFYLGKISKSFFLRFKGLLQLQNKLPNLTLLKTD